MKSRIWFRENGTVIHTRSPWYDRVRSWVLALLIAVVVLVLPGLLDPLPLDEPLATQADLVQHMAELEHAYLEALRVQSERAAKAYDEGLRAGQQVAAEQCLRGGRL